MNLNRRVEILENLSETKQKSYVIIPKDDETCEEAQRRYCQEKNITEADLDAGRVFQIVLVSPGDV